MYQACGFMVESELSVGTIYSSRPASSMRAGCNFFIFTWCFKKLLASGKKAFAGGLKPFLMAKQ
ncbi:MAG: hypothetical protein FVQ79_11730 [Planctomycetes bacterium]|nr:hypothetical protein [Planctomycetota bacterium]